MANDDPQDELRNTDRPHADPSPPSESRVANSRRDALRKVGKKALYVVPAIVILAAMPEKAWASAPASGTCTVSGGACGVAADCCSNSCNTTTMTCDPI